MSTLENDFFFLKSEFSIVESIDFYILPDEPVKAISRLPPVLF